MNLTSGIGKLTRWLQSLSPNKPIGISTLSRKLYRLLPRYQGVIELEDGLNMHLDTNIPPERGIFFAGDRHRVLTAVMQQYVKQGAYCMDIGANIGFYTLKLAQLVGSSGRIAAFEANPTLVTRIRENISLNNFNHINLVNKAVNHMGETATFYITANSELSSLEYRDNAVEKITVHATTIDEFMEESNWERLDFIKLDIEGHDCHALIGANRTLRNFRPYIVLEYHYHSDTVIAAEAFEILKEIGYTIEGIILRSGKRLPFDWQHPHTKDAHHINLLCRLMTTR
ncbi:MAG: FkbM family methyltransferase [Anaerolineae bacterium]|nr:FkbM family methyltransferase [Anaerolineae bacterium]